MVHEKSFKPIKLFSVILKETPPRILCGGLILSPVSRPAEPDPYNFLRFVSGCDSMIRAVREEINAKILEILQTRGASLAFPSRSVYLSSV